jgi:hypothetical protein
LPQASKSKKCTKCNLEFSSKYKFCTECGQGLKKINNCPSCDVPVGKTSKFCPVCGTNLQNVNSHFTSASEEETPYTEETKSKESEYLAIGYTLSGIIFIIFVIWVIMSLSGNNSGTVYNEDPFSCMKNSYYDPNTGTVYFPSC